MNKSDILFDKGRLLIQKAQGRTTDEVAVKIKYVCRKIGVEFNLYRLSHKFSTDLVTGNVDPRTIMELMGHNNIGQTLEYARSNDALKNRKYS